MNGLFQKKNIQEGRWVDGVEDMEFLGVLKK